MKKIVSAIILSTIFMACNAHKSEKPTKENYNKTTNMDTITLGAGCFWCVEAIFQNIKGVESVVSGYANGTIINPTYKEVCTGTTGHVEVCQLVYNPETVSLITILEVFFQTHNPTTLNRQGADVGTQYRSGIYYETEQQEEIAKTVFNQLDDAGVFLAPIVTEITPLLSFYPAEDYHQDYYEINGEQPYCRAVIQPKVEQLKKEFSKLLK